MRTLICAFLVFLGGCRLPLGADSPTLRTPGGMEVEASVPVDLDALDNAWNSVIDCWSGRVGYSVNVDPPKTVVRSDGVVTLPNGCHYWRWGVWYIAGQTGSKEVWVADGPCMISTARHEYAHYVENRVTGSTDPVYAGCDGSGR